VSWDDVCIGAESECAYECEDDENEEEECMEECMVDKCGDYEEL